MGLTINSIFNLNSEKIANSRLELKMTEDSGGMAHIDKWLTADQNDKASGIADRSYWGWYERKKNFNIGQYIFSFVKISSDEWLFISAAKIVEIPPNSRAKENNI